LVAAWQTPCLRDRSLKEESNCIGELKKHSSGEIHRIQGTNFVLHPSYFMNGLISFAGQRDETA
jgi:hypothetical protein